MDVRKLLFLVVSLCLVSAVAVFAGIEGTKHDFSGAAWSGNEICLPCHTAHNADPCEGAPLWSHAVVTTGKTYTPYTSTTIDINEPGYVGGSVTFTGTSKLCLSCHDGSVNLDAYTGGGDTTGIADVNVAAKVTKTGGTNDLSRMHPIGFRYRNALVNADGELQSVATVNSSAVVLEDYTDADTGGLVTCSSCHDVHGSVASADPLLVMSNTGSDLCLTCHNK